MVEEQRNSAGLWGEKTASIIVVVIVTVLVVWLSYSTSTLGTDPWYANLAKPPGVIPDVGFSIVWSILYALILVGVIYAIVVTTSPATRGRITILYTIILLLTLLWVWVFGTLQQTGAGLVVLLLTVILVASLCWQSRSGQLRSPARRWDWLPSVTFALLLLWLLVATYYNGGIVALN